ncbi:MAG: prolyl oligopeptidase family serine peptidase, partial [Steroidobacteraceae bacterium]
PMTTSTDIVTGLPATPTTQLVYPVTARVNVSDDYNGEKVADPYRWLENLDSQATKDWVAAQNRLSQPRLEGIPQRAWIKQRLTQLWNYERFNTPVKEGGRYFFLHNDGKQNQSVLFVADSLEAPGRVLFDPNAMRADATVAVADFTPSPQGDRVAYALSDGGTDWQIWRFRRVADGTDSADTLRFTKFWGVSWARDGSGVYYSRYPALPNGKGDDAGRPAVYFHKIGDSQESDRLIYAVPDPSTRVPSARVTEDGHYLVITLFDGYDRNGVSLLDLRQPGAKVTALFSAWDALYTFIGSSGDHLYFHTTKDAPLRRVIEVDARRPAAANWPTIVPEDSVALEEASYVGGRIVAKYIYDAHSVARVFTVDGRMLGQVPLPGMGSVEGFFGEGKDTETFFSYTDYLTPPQVYRYDVTDNKSTLWRKATVAASLDAYVTEQVFYISKDGTRVPMFITHRRDMVRDGSQPFLLYGYGGFNVSLTPTFRASVLAWLEMGGAYAEANLRGGGEYGEAWHQAGTLQNKQHVFDDFISAAEYLVRERYTRPQKLGIHGRSNGGLLVGAALTQRPELFGAALPAVGVLDMLRYHTASANARQWSSDYGLSDDPDQFKALYAYSPVHNVKKGMCYPPTLITTADHDDRVVPWHSYKFAAALQAVQICSNPILIRVETRAGHGAGKPVWMQIDDFADQWAFLAKWLG